MPKFGMSNLAPALAWPKYFYQGFNRQYFRKVLSIDHQNLIAHWPMWEASGSVAVDLSPQGNNGAYTTVTLGQPGIGDGRSCALFDGANDYNNVYSVPFRSDFSGAAGSISIWAKVLNAAVWEDDTTRMFIRLRADANNRVELLKTTSDNQLQMVYRAGGTSEIRNKNNVSTLDFFQMGITWDKAAEEVKAYFNGVQVGATMAALGTWAGLLSATNAVIGAASTTPASVHSGYLAQAAVWKVAHSAQQMLSLAQR